METKRFLLFYQGLNRIVKDIKRLEMLYMREHGLRSVHIGCLLHIKSSDHGMTVTQLSRACKIDKSLISRVIKELIADGFIMAIGSEKTYNKKYVLTDKSEKFTAQIDDIISNCMSLARKDIAEDDLATFYQVLSTLENNISLIVQDEQ